MSDIAKVIDGVIRGGLAPHLKAAGFRKHARTFIRDAGSCAHIVNVQASQWNAGVEGQFTLNIGVYFPKVAERRGMPAKGTYPKEYDSTLRARIGSLMPDGLDHWWTIREGTDTVAVATDVLNAYVRFAAAWLDEASNLETVFRRLREGNPLMAASAALELGKKQDTEVILADAYLHASSHFAPTVKRFAEKHGIALPVA